MRTSTYKMSSHLKTRLALGKWKSKEQKNAWKRAMISAEIESQKKVSTKGQKESD